jgi:hypothetical protein
MRHGLVLAALLLPLGGCYEQPPGPGSYAQPGSPPGGYGQPGYPPPSYGQPGYPPPGYGQPGYPPPGYNPAEYPVAGPYDPNGTIYPGYSDNGGSPTLFVDGAVVPLILFGGGWGYYDTHHDFHRAPDAVSRHLEQQRAAGGFHPGSGGFAPPGAGGRPAPPPGGFHPASGGFAQPRPEGRPPQAAEANRGQFSSHPGEQPHPAATSAASPRATPPPQPVPAHERHGRDCPQGQRC